MHKAIVFQIEEEMLSKHPNADKLQILNFDGVEICVSKEYKVGTICMYFPLDTQISEWFLKAHNLYRHSEKNEDTTVVGFFEDSGRVRGIRLRGVISLGFVYVPSLGEIEKWNLKIGESYNFVDGVELCRKYYTPTELKIQKENSNNPNLNKKQKKKNDFSEYFKKLGEVPNLFEYINNLNVGDKLLLTLKLHGTSGRTGNLPIETKWNWKELLNFNFRKFLNKKIWSVQTGSRNVNLYHTNFSAKNDGFYEGNFRKTIHDKFVELGVKEGEIFYYEIVGYTDKGGAIQKIGETVFNYGLNSPNFEIYVYKIEQLVNSSVFKVLTYDEMVKRCLELNLKVVPTLKEVSFESKEQLLGILKNFDEIYSDNDPIGHHLCEGIVIRVADKWKVCKYKFKEFCLRENIQSTEDKFNLENIS